MRAHTKPESKTAARRRGAAVAIGVGAIVVLAACGSSSKASVSPSAQPSGSTTSTTAPTSSTAAAAAPVVATAQTDKGMVLVDKQGMTLYTLTNAGAPVPCPAACVSIWPPLYTTAGATTATGPAGVTGLGTVAATGGTQVTDNGDPLYRFSVDKAPGDTKGDGISGFGGIWHVVTVAKTSSSATTLAPVDTAPATTVPATSPTTMAGYGGY